MRIIESVLIVTLPLSLLTSVLPDKLYDKVGKLGRFVAIALTVALMFVTAHFIDNRFFLIISLIVSAVIFWLNKVNERKEDLINVWSAFSFAFGAILLISSFLKAA